MFFQWPAQEMSLIQAVVQYRVSYEVYFAPSIFTEKSSKKESVKGSYVYWIEFDGTVPPDLKGLPDPNIVIQSSDETHQHLYWCTDRLIAPAKLESTNRSLAYLLQADASGWDCNQVLRPPETLNHKKSRKVQLKAVLDNYVSDLAFSEVPSPPKLEPLLPEELPPIEEVVRKHNFPVQVWKLFKNGVPQGYRSDGLMALGYHLAELNLGNAEILAMLINADQRWGKFAKRNDQLVRLMEIVTRARLKYPFKIVPDLDTQPLQSIGFKELLATEITLEWVWEGLLQKAGYFLLTGPTGVGKTQFSTNFAAKIALGQPFLDREIAAPLKLGLFSLEMGLAEIKFFLKQQSVGYSQDDLEMLEQNFRIFPMGEPLYLNQNKEKIRLERVIEEENLQGIIIDSLGSITDEELSSEVQVKNIMDWFDRLRQHYGVFVWLLHHHRKAQGQNKKPNKISDVYGSQYITARATTVMALWETSVANAIASIPLKVRLTKRPEPFFLFRDNQLNFTLKKNVSVMEQSVTEDLTEEDEEGKVEMLADVIDLTDSKSKGLFPIA